MLHNHIHNNGVLARKYARLDRIWLYVLQPLMGHTWDRNITTMLNTTMSKTTASETSRQLFAINETILFISSAMSVDLCYLFGLSFLFIFSEEGRQVLY